ncbi:MULTISPECIES: EscU/YscU/HrcU family type III secretion system export apparatus switch protein [unclassified Thioalkalivibrio]|uniref:EscU/YscU/HrcU family type III secretion system export apparatus switch protein n=1 Tax=unclassified Thioalkalivibrio TaxID=2621013 RepID=UPI00047605FA|nr:MULTISPECIES: EscU/YscU/HrcU family type III secretion system export apparatus switch protein [unclassified Thioalkalivibrio]
MAHKDAGGRSKKGHSPPERAVALEWDRRRAPKITASGSGLTAEAILRIAEEHGIPLHQDPALSEALAQVPVGSEIPEELYVAVAEILAFVFLLAGITPDDRAGGYQDPSRRPPSHRDRGGADS